MPTIAKKSPKGLSGAFYIYSMLFFVQNPIGINKQTTYDKTANYFI
jgi:hypothetical protein